MNRRWLALGASILVIVMFGTAGAVSDQAGSVKDKPQKHSSSDRKGQGFGHRNDKRAGPTGKGFPHGRPSALGSLLSDEEARASIGAAIAKTLGMTTEQLRAALKDETKDLEDLIEEKGVTEEQLGAAVAAAAEPHLDRLVVAGTIEREAADELLERMSEGAWIGKLARLAAIAGG